MKIIFTILITIYSLNTYSQMNDISGTYLDKIEENDIIVEFELQLKPDGTFDFRFYQDQRCYEETERAQGTWKLENGKIIFDTPPHLITETHQISFSGTEAEVKSDTLTFTQSPSFWIKKKALRKVK